MMKVESCSGDGSGSDGGNNNNSNIMSTTMRFAFGVETNSIESSASLSTSFFGDLLRDAVLDSLTTNMCVIDGGDDGNNNRRRSLRRSNINNNNDNSLHDSEQQKQEAQRQLHRRQLNVVSLSIRETSEDVISNDEYSCVIMGNDNTEQQQWILSKSCRIYDFIIDIMYDEEAPLNTEGRNIRTTRNIIEDYCTSNYYVQSMNAQSPSSNEIVTYVQFGASMSIVEKPAILQEELDELVLQQDQEQVALENEAELEIAEVAVVASEDEDTNDNNSNSNIDGGLEEDYTTDIDNSSNSDSDSINNESNNALSKNDVIINDVNTVIDTSKDTTTATTTDTDTDTDTDISSNSNTNINTVDTTIFTDGDADTSAFNDVGTDTSIFNDIGTDTSIFNDVDTGTSTFNDVDIGTTTINDVNTDTTTLNDVYTNTTTVAIDAMDKTDIAVGENVVVVEVGEKDANNDSIEIIDTTSTNAVIIDTDITDNDFFVSEKDKETTTTTIDDESTTAVWVYGGDDNNGNTSNIIVETGEDAEIGVVDGIDNEAANYMTLERENGAAKKGKDRSPLIVSSINAAEEQQDGRTKLSTLGSVFVPIASVMLLAIFALFFLLFQKRNKQKKEKQQIGDQIIKDFHSNDTDDDEENNTLGDVVPKEIDDVDNNGNTELQQTSDLTMKRTNSISAESVKIHDYHNRGINNHGDNDHDYKTMKIIGRSQSEPVANKKREANRFDGIEGTTIVTTKSRISPGGILRNGYSSLDNDKGEEYSNYLATHVENKKLVLHDDDDNEIATNSALCCAEPFC